jgi:pyruvate formate lyase activating enzyme
MREVDYFINIDDKIKCLLCPHECVLSKNQKGICNVRKNVDGRLLAENYSKLVSIATDPIEKKPLYHFFPSKKVLSVASYGCNFKCRWCQNWTISQKEPPSEKYTPADLVNYIKSKNLDMIAFTYSEPLMWFEYIMDFAKQVKKEAPDFKIILVTNGFISREPLEDLIEYIDAVNLDIKGMSDDIYVKLIKGKLNPVLRSAKMFYKNNIHLEITDLMVTGINDSKNDVRKLSNWIKDELSDNVPLHLSRYYPNYNMNNDPTSKEKMINAYKEAKKILKYVYVGNIFIREEYNNTMCFNCNTKLIDRSFFSSKIINLSDKGRCNKCGAKIYVRI